jgi:H+/Cl- antiporter ClcA
MPRIFDVRNIIGALLGIYGVLLTIAGFFPAVLHDHESSATGNRADLYVGTDANWWVGLILLAVAAVFFVWALLRPVRVDENASPAADPENRN